MRAIRVGYMENCMAFLDDDGNKLPSLQEEAQPTSADGGAIALFPAGSTEPTPAQVRLDVGQASDPCVDSLSDRKAPAIILTAAEGAVQTGSQMTCSRVLEYFHFAA
jgi:hypothetical protein